MAEKSATIFTCEMPDKMRDDAVTCVSIFAKYNDRARQKWQSIKKIHPRKQYHNTLRSTLTKFTHLIGTVL